MLEELKQSLQKASVVKKGKYEYFVHPITDGIPKLEPKLLNEVVQVIKKIANLKCDKIVTPQSAGIWIATPLSLETGIPLVVVRKRQYGLPGEVSVDQVTGYEKSELFVNGINKNDKVLLIDDVVSTGGTIKALVSTLNYIGAEISDIVVVISRCQNKKDLENKIGQKIKTLVEVDLKNGKVIVK